MTIDLQFVQLFQLLGLYEQRTKWVQTLQVYVYDRFGQYNSHSYSSPTIESTYIDCHIYL